MPNLYGANEPHTVLGVDGYATRDSAEAVVTGADFTVTGPDWPTIYGGYSDSGANVYKNKVTLNGVVVGNNVYGGYSEGGYSDGCNVSGNTVIIKGANTIKSPSEGVWGSVYGGYAASTGTASGNTVIVEKKATLTGNIYGGYGNGSDSEVSGNNVYIYGTVNGNVYGGKLDNAGGSITNNTVTLGKADDPAAKAKITDVLVLNEKGKPTSGGTLNVYNSGHTVGGKLLSDDTDHSATGATINFYINADDMREGGKTMLSVEGNANLSGVNINAGVLNAGSVKKGDKIILIAVDGPERSLYVDGDTKFNTIAASDGIMKAELDIQLYGSAGEGTPITERPHGETNGKIVAIAKNDAEADLGPDSAAKSPVETMAASVSLINASADMMAGEAMTGAAQSTALAAAENSSSTLAPFAAVGGSKTRVESGSHVDLNSWNIAAGFAKEVENRQGKLMFAPVVEYGRGSYDSYLDNGTHGDGTSSFLGIGVMAKQTNKDGLYYEGSLRGGRAKSDYSSNFTGVDNVTYDTSAAYYAMHLGVGKVVKLDEKDSLDCYGKLFYSHQAGDRAHLSNGYDYDFKAVDSIRTRLGVRYTHKINDKSSIYTGLAWQHEFDSKAKATIISGGTSFDAPSPSIKGDTGIFELGWKIKPGKGNFETGLGFTGSVGKQRGVGLNAQFHWMF